MNSSRQIEIFDSTLRDGAQGEGISFSVHDKLQILKLWTVSGSPMSKPVIPDRIRKTLSSSAELQSLNSSTADLPPSAVRADAISPWKMM